MKSIEIMVEEHTNIRRVLKIIRNVCYRILTNDEYEIDDVPRIIDFVRSYADDHHHGKEEDILFVTMNDSLEAVKRSGAITGMLIEHDNGRLYMRNLEEAVKSYNDGSDEARIDIIANAVSYADLLDRHIEKENTALYKLAERLLPEDKKEFIEVESKKLEDAATEAGVQKKYLDLIEELEKKYN